MAALDRFRCDDETGEIITYQVNEETGEPSNIHKSFPINSGRELKCSRKHIKFPRGYMSKTKKFQTLKEKILSGSNTVSHRMLLSIPTLMIFPSLVCVMLVILEIFLHIGCHRKNVMLKDSNLFYQSPFHVVTSIFCGVCRDSNTALKITALQDKRRFHYDYFTGS
ncbi:uncharacterized protein LOC123718553 [Pieris brassicae]|uniref:uncharacterized protein LOC123718553 n=1 Tax=Pieris brassicae TaxID=7116 RepID=UPI001E6605D9|nr:uncharacterized protein LOC123718553 [Pieris brassicae]